MKFRYKTNMAYLVLIKLMKMTSNSDFESQPFNPFSVSEQLQNNELGPDVNYYLDQISSLDTKYYVPGEVKEQLKNLQLNSFSALHLNIRSMKKHFEAFQDFIESLNYLSETWLQPHEISDSNFQFPGYYSFHLTREMNREGRLCIFLQETYSCKFRKDLQVNSKTFKCLHVEVENKNSKNFVPNLVYLPRWSQRTRKIL